MRRGWSIAALGALVAASVGGCGPIAYVVAVNDAAQSVEQARQAGAPESAGYDYWYAVEHLNKAREFAGEAEYQNAMDMAGEAEESGDRAAGIARRRQHEQGR